MPITKPTVLILGAGASSPYGFPLGLELLKEATRSLDVGSDVYNHLQELGHSDSQIVSTREALEHSGYQSIDAFLEDYPTHADIGKLAVAGAILGFEAGGRRFLQTTSAPTVGDWYRYLVNNMDAGRPGWSENKLSIVTFNYDRSFERYCMNVLGQRTGGGDGAAAELLQMVPVVHVYGSMGTLEEQPYGEQPSAESILATAGRIELLDRRAVTSERFQQARALLDQAERIYFLGFGFNATNVERLGAFNDRASGPRATFISGTMGSFRPREWTRIHENALNLHWTGGHQRYSDSLAFLRDAELD